MGSPAPLGLAALRIRVLATQEMQVEDLIDLLLTNGMHRIDLQSGADTDILIDYG